MANDSKRTECVKVCFTERELIDLNRLAIAEDRKCADMARVMVVRGMYGIVPPRAQPAEGTKEDHESP